MSALGLQREGFTFDTILSLIRKTALNPAITVPLYLASLYTEKGRQIVSQRPIANQWLQSLAALSVFRGISGFLDKGMLNNWANDVYDWKQEIVVVTGGSDGIGALVVQMLAKKGVKVVILDIQKPKFEVPSNVKYFHCDLASAAKIHEVAAAVTKEVGAPTIMVSNAGFARGNTILSAKENDINLTFKINALSHYHLAQAYLPSMIKHNHGLWVTVASLAGYVTAPGLTDYSASKASALVFHEGLSAELATAYKAPAVRTVLVCQGYTRTALFQGFHQGDGFMNYALDPATVAESIVKAVFRAQSDHIILPVGNSYIAGLRNWPGWMQSYVRKDLKKMMVNWNGRQVAQPSEGGSGSEVATPVDNKGLETSAVLV